MSSAEFGGNSYTYFDHQTAFAQTYGMRPEQMAEHYRGLLAGMMGLPLIDPTPIFRIGYELGAAGKAKAEELRNAAAEREEAFRERQKAKGERSAEARKARSGSAQPSKSHKDASNRGSGDSRTVVREMSNRGSNRGSGILEPLRKEGSNRKANAFLKAPCKSDLSANSARAISEPGEEGQICKKRGWQDLSSRPSLEDFLAYAAEQWPEWHRDDLERIYAGLVRRNWTDQDGASIANWQSLLASFRFHVDPAHLGERYPLGQFVRNLLEGAA